MVYINEAGYPKTPGLKLAAERVMRADEVSASRKVNWARGGETQPVRYRIRRCTGNTDCWMLVALNSYGDESTANGSFTTSTSIDLLLKHAGHLTPNAGEHVDFVA